MNLIYLLLILGGLAFMLWALRRGAVARRSDRELAKREREKMGLA